MADAPLISIVTSTFREIADGARADGRDSTLGAALASVIAQSYPAWELHLVADHPPEADFRRIAALVEGLADPRIRLRNLGRWGGLDFPGWEAKVAGVEEATGELLAFLDADNTWSRRHLERAVEAFAADPDVDLVYSDTRVRLRGRDDLEALRRLSPAYALMGPLVGESFIWRKPEWGDAARRKLERLNFIDTSDAVMRRRAYDASGGLPRVDNLDWNLWRAMLASGRDRFRRVPHVGSTFRTATLGQHLEYAAASFAEGFDLPFHLEAYRTLTKGAFVSHHRRKHFSGNPGEEAGC